MKKTKILYWVFTGIFCAFMISTAIPDVLLSPDAVTFMKHIGYADYFTRFIGIAKILGGIALLVPGFPRIKEWAYAGFFFDLFGAVYSIVATDGFDPQMSFMVLPFTLLFLSYVYHHKLLKAKQISNS